MFNPFEPGYAANPYPHYREQRETAPIQKLPFGPWILFGYDDSIRLLRDTSTSVDERKALALDPERERLRATLLAEVAPGQEVRERMSILSIDPPDHTRLRRLVSSVFTPRRISELQPLVARLVQEHLDAVAAEGRMDLIADLAFPLPFTVISEMMGMPTEDRDQVREWSHTMVRILDFTIGPEEFRDALTAGEAMRAHLTGVIAWKRENPADDLLSDLIRAEEDGEVLSDVELLEQVMLLYIAGHETTVNLIGNGTWALLGDLDQLALWSDDDSIDATAIDELLRYDSPVQLSRRIALEPMEIHGNEIDAGSFVFTSLGSANHDPAMFGADSEQLDLRRVDASRHLSFGSGTHHCLGASLARLQGIEAITGLVRRFPNLRAAVDVPDWNGRLVLRGMESLPLVWH
jgi:cytochrome P450